MTTTRIWPHNKEEAQEWALNLVQELNDTVGGNWVPSVWRNSSWCYEAILGSMQVSELRFSNGAKHYTCYVSDDAMSGGSPDYWFKDSFCKTPKEAVDHAMGEARAFVDRVSAVVKANEYLTKKGFNPQEAIDTVEMLWPPDSEYPDTRSIGQGFLQRAIEDVYPDWRELPEKVLIRLAQLNLAREHSNR